MNKQTKIKGYLLLFLIISSIFISLVGQGYTATKVAAPNPAKEYPQDNLMVIDMNNLPGTQIKSMGKEELQQYAFFIIEATNAGIESRLMEKALNPGGIKYRGTGKKINAMDDCYKNGKKIPCAFQAYTSYNAMVQGWADVLNLPRYKNCKRYMLAKYNRGMSAKQIVDATCKCFYKSGYHTSNLWKVRSNLSTEYWTLKASFPEMEY
jgi:hypothetical protein